MRNKLLFVICLAISYVQAQTETLPTGSYIVDMGIVPQTIGNGLKPYGMVYDLVTNYNVPVKWVIRPNKSKDSFDFIHNGIRYSGGPFVIPKTSITNTVLSRINYWATQGVEMDTSVSSFNVDVYRTFKYMPNWTINNDNISLATIFFTQAGIPSTSYNFKLPATLGPCDDIFMMPHSDPTWATHNNLLDWNTNYKGAIWAACHAVSVLEGITNPSNSAIQLNFLSNTGLINYTSHSDGTPPFNYYFNRASYNGSPISSRPDDAVFQIIGTHDGAHNNGSERIFIPRTGTGGGWRNTTKIVCFDSTQANVTGIPHGPAALSLYGRGFGLSNSGLVMYQGGHNIAETRVGSSRFITADNVTAVRQFLNFSFVAMEDKNPSLFSSSVPSVMSYSSTYGLSVNANSPVSATLNYQWSATCGGTFSNPNSASTTFTPDTTTDSTCRIRCVVTDACNRIIVSENIVHVYASLPLNLLKFVGIKKGYQHHLKWTSSAEENMKSYVILRSTDGENFEEIAQVKPHNKFSLSDYEYTDVFYQQQDYVYYQLKMVDNDNSYRLSDVIELNFNQVHSDIKSIQPNPAQGELTIETKFSASQFNRFYITDIQGRIVKEVMDLQSQQKEFKLDINDLNSGLYVVSIIKKNGEKVSAKFSKQ